jgi:hypothetical protein
MIEQTVDLIVEVENLVLLDVRVVHDFYYSIKYKNFIFLKIFSLIIHVMMFALIVLMNSYL